MTGARRGERCDVAARGPLVAIKAVGESGGWGELGVGTPWLGFGRAAKGGAARRRLKRRLVEGGGRGWRRRRKRKKKPNTVDRKFFLEQPTAH